MEIVVYRCDDCTEFVTIDSPDPQAIGHVHCPECDGKMDCHSVNGEKV